MRSFVKIESTTTEMKMILYFYFHSLKEANDYYELVATKKLYKDNCKITLYKGNSTKVKQIINK